MLLKELHLKRFGCLDDFSASFQPGFNIIRGPNESGKSTLHQGLLMALMIPPTKTQANSVWRAWGTDHYYWLQLTFTDQEGGSYQITKDFDAGFQELMMPTGKTTGKRDAIERTLETVLGTSSSLMFRSTLCVRQDALAEIESGRREIAQSLETIVTGSEDDTYTEQTLKKLDKVMKEFRKGYSRTAAKPGPLAKVRDDQALLVTRVSEHTTQVQSQEDDQWLLEKTETRLAEIDLKLGPALVTQEQAKRVLRVKSELEEWEMEEEELETRLNQVKSAQAEIDTAETNLLALGPVAQLTEEDVREAAELYSRWTTLRENYVTYQKAMVQYKGDLVAHQENQATYEQAASAYDLALAAYKGEQAQYREDMEAYNAAVSQYDRDLDAYQAALAPYEIALQARKEESGQYEVQRAQYQKELAIYEAELVQYKNDRSQQEQQLADYDRSYEEFEQQRDTYDQAQTAYQQAMATYESAVTSKPSGSVSGKTILLTIGALVAVMGLVLLLLVEGPLPGVALFVIGAVLLLVGILRKSPADQRDRTSVTERPEFPTLERPAAPQRPKFDQLMQPQPPTPLKPLESASEGLEKPDIERPQPLLIEQPSPPNQNQPEPPMPLPPTPDEPYFDKKPIVSTISKLKGILVAADCSSVDELKKRFSQAAALRGKQAEARSRLEGLLGDRTSEELEGERRDASRQRRDAQETLDDPDLLRAASITLLEYNQIGREIESLEEEQVDLLKKRQRLQINIENQPISTEDLMRAEEALEEASEAYRRAQERLAVYELTHEVLNEARTRTLKKAQERLGPQTVTYLGRLTHGRYEQAWIDSDLNIELEDPIHPDRRIQTDRLSRGTQDQLYMAARLALVDLLFPGTQPPILLDDPFVHFDPQRLAAAIEMCCEVAAERQILLFTCSDNYNQVGHHILMPAPP